MHQQPCPEACISNMLNSPDEALDLRMLSLPQAERCLQLCLGNQPGCLG